MESVESLRNRMRYMRLVALLEGSTLVVLVCIAVPLKHLLGMPQMVSVIGPIHGMAFLLYLWMVINVVSGEAWSKIEITRVLFAAVVPFGAFLNASFMRHKEDEIVQQAEARA
ncbi:MAG: DUF3817 domain-containing protein [Pseudomonadota bacterium]